LRETALQSDGIWLTSARLAAADLEAGRLVQLDVVDSPVPARIEVCMTQVEGMMLSPAAAAEFVRDYFQSE
jgi:DNA-binding transcriptional LysR family regulator